MDANSTHPDYDAEAAQWSRARDVIAGEDAVKAAGEKYLPRLDSQSEEEYAAYKARASFFGATARTLEEYLDLVFRRAPVVAVGERKELQGFVGDCDLWGLDLVRYARLIVREVLSVGRGLVGAVARRCEAAVGFVLADGGHHQLEGGASWPGGGVGGGGAAGCGQVARAEDG